VGVEIGVICATRGQCGKTVTFFRAADVRNAAQILGIQHLEILSYEDQMLASAPPDEIRRALVAALRRQRRRSRSPSIRTA
jgi:LmbE family N-acetylglucosaminyl deacetylase